MKVAFETDSVTVQNVWFYPRPQAAPFSLRGVGWWTIDYATGAPQKIGGGRELPLPTAAVLRLLKRRLCYSSVGSAGSAGLALRRPCFANLWAKRSRPSMSPSAFFLFNRK